MLHAHECFARMASWGVYRQSIVMQVERAQLREVGNALGNGANELAALGSDDAANREDEHSPGACIALSSRALRAVHFWVGVGAVT